MQEAPGVEPGASAHVAAGHPGHPGVGNPRKVLTTGHPGQAAFTKTGGVNLMNLYEKNESERATKNITENFDSDESQCTLSITTRLRVTGGCFTDGDQAALHGGEDGVQPIGVSLSLLIRENNSTKEGAASIEQRPRLAIGDNSLAPDQDQRKNLTTSARAPATRVVKPTKLQRLNAQLRLNEQLANEARRRYMARTGMMPANHAPLRRVLNTPVGSMSLPHKISTKEKPGATTASQQYDKLETGEESLSRLPSLLPPPLGSTVLQDTYLEPYKLNIDGQYITTNLLTSTNAQLHDSVQLELEAPTTGHPSRGGAPITGHPGGAPFNLVSTGTALVTRHSDQGTIELKPATPERTDHALGASRDNPGHGTSGPGDRNSPGHGTSGPGHCGASVTGHPDRAMDTTLLINMPLEASTTMPTLHSKNASTVMPTLQIHNPPLKWELLPTAGAPGEEDLGKAPTPIDEALQVLLHVVRNQDRLWCSDRYYYAPDKETLFIQRAHYDAACRVMLAYGCPAIETAPGEPEFYVQFGEKLYAGAPPYTEAHQPDWQQAVEYLHNILLLATTQYGRHLSPETQLNQPESKLSLRVVSFFDTLIQQNRQKRPYPKWPKMLLVILAHPAIQYVLPQPARPEMWMPMASQQRYPANGYYQDTYDQQRQFQMSQAMGQPQSPNFMQQSMVFQQQHGTRNKQYYHDHRASGSRGQQGRTKEAKARSDYLDESDTGRPTNIDYGEQQTDSDLVQQLRLSRQRVADLEAENIRIAYARKKAQAGELAAQLEVNKTQHMAEIERLQSAGRAQAARIAELEAQYSTQPPTADKSRADDRQTMPELRNEGDQGANETTRRPIMSRPSAGERASFEGSDSRGSARKPPIEQLVTQRLTSHLIQHFGYVSPQAISAANKGEWVMGEMSSILPKVKMWVLTNVRVEQMIDDQWCRNPDWCKRSGPGPKNIKELIHMFDLEAIQRLYDFLGKDVTTYEMSWTSGANWRELEIAKKNRNHAAWLVDFTAACNTSGEDCMRLAFHNRTLLGRYRGSICLIRSELHGCPTRVICDGPRLLSTRELYASFGTSPIQNSLNTMVCWPPRRDTSPANGSPAIDLGSPADMTALATETTAAALEDAAPPDPLRTLCEAAFNMPPHHGSLLGEEGVPEAAEGAQATDVDMFETDPKDLTIYTAPNHSTMQECVPKAIYAQRQRTLCLQNCALTSQVDLQELQSLIARRGDGLVLGVPFDDAMQRRLVDSECLVDPRATSTQSFGVCWIEPQTRRLKFYPALGTSDRRASQWYAPIVLTESAHCAPLANKDEQCTGLQVGAALYARFVGEHHFSVAHLVGSNESNALPTAGATDVGISVPVHIFVVNDAMQEPNEQLANGMARYTRYVPFGQSVDMTIFPLTTAIGQVFDALVVHGGHGNRESHYLRIWESRHVVWDYDATLAELFWDQPLVEILAVRGALLFELSPRDGSEEQWQFPHGYTVAERDVDEGSDLDDNMPNMSNYNGESVRARHEPQLDDSARDGNADGDVAGNNVGELLDAIATVPNPTRRHECVPLAVYSQCITTAHAMGLSSRADVTFAMLQYAILTRGDGLPLGVAYDDAMQRKLIDTGCLTKIGSHCTESFGLCWIEPQNYTVKFYPAARSDASYYAPIVLTESTHCEPLAKQEGGRTGLMTFHALCAQFVEQRRYTLVSTVEGVEACAMPTAGAPAADGSSADGTAESASPFSEVSGAGDGTPLAATPSLPTLRTVDGYGAAKSADLRAASKLRQPPRTDTGIKPTLHGRGPLKAADAELPPSLVTMHAGAAALAQVPGGFSEREKLIDAAFDKTPPEMLDVASCFFESDLSQRYTYQLSRVKLFFAWWIYVHSQRDAHELQQELGKVVKAVSARTTRDVGELRQALRRESSVNQQRFEIVAGNMTDMKGAMLEQSRSINTSMETRFEDMQARDYGVQAQLQQMSTVLQSLAERISAQDGKSDPSVKEAPATRAVKEAPATHASSARLDTLSTRVDMRRGNPTPSVGATKIGPVRFRTEHVDAPLSRAQAEKLESQAELETRIRERSRAALDAILRKPNVGTGSDPTSKQLKFDLGGAHGRDLDGRSHDAPYSHAPGSSHPYGRNADAQLMQPVASGNRTVIAILHTCTTLLPNGFTQRVQGAPWSRLSYGTNNPPALEQGVTYYGLIDLETPVIDGATYATDVKARVEDIFDTQIKAPIQLDALRECRTRSLDVGVTDDLISMSQSPMIPWPTTWRRGGASRDLPENLIIMRIHFGWDEDSFASFQREGDEMSQFLSIINHVAAEHIQRRCIDPSGDRLDTPAKILFQNLHSRYITTIDERPVLKILFHLAGMQPCLYDFITSLGSPPPTAHPDAVAAFESRGEHQSSSKPYKLKDSLLSQLQGIASRVMKEWKAPQTVQLWNLRIVHAWSNGEMRTYIPTMLEFGIHASLEAIRTLLVGCILERSPSFAAYYARPDNELAMRDSVSKQAASYADAKLKRGTAFTPDDAIQLFIEGLTSMMLVIRSVPYARDADQMARQELRRLLALRKPEGLPDDQWWTEASSRFRNWHTLLGDELMGRCADELREFLTVVTQQVTDRATRNEIIRHANKFAADVLRSSGIKSYYDLLGHELLHTTRLSRPLSGRKGGTLLLTGNLIEQPEDMNKVWMIGEGLYAKGVGVTGPSFTLEFMTISERTVGDAGVFAASFGASQPADSLLSADVTQPQCVVLHNDLFYANAAFPPIDHLLPAGTIERPPTQLLQVDTHPTSQPGPRAAQRQSTLQTAQASDAALDTDTLKKDVTSADVSVPVQTTKISFAPQKRADTSATEDLFALLDKPVSEWPEMTTQNVHMAFTEMQKRVDRSEGQFREQLAHLAELFRAQMKNVASPLMSHATKTDNIHAVTGSSEHDADRGRKNLGTGGNRRMRRPAALVNGMRYSDKPPTKYADINAPMVEHLRNILGITDEAAWLREGAKVCPLCQAGDHLLWHCLKIFASTVQGEKFFGADKAAQRVRETLKSRPDISLMEVYDVYLACMADDGDRDAVDRGFDAIIEDSSLLCTLCSSDDPHALQSPALVTEFDMHRNNIVNIMHLSIASPPAPVSK